MLRARAVPASRSGARVTCAGEWGGAAPAEVPVPASCAAPAPASAPVPGALGHVLPGFLVKLSQCGRGGADINPSAAGPAYPGAPPPALPCRAPRLPPHVPGPPSRRLLPAPCRSPGPGRRPSRLLLDAGPAEASLVAGLRTPEVHRITGLDPAADSSIRGSGTLASLSGRGQHSRPQA